MKTKATRWTEKCKAMIILMLKQKAATLWRCSQWLPELKWNTSFFRRRQDKQSQTNYEGVVRLWMRSWKKCAPVCRYVCMCVCVPMFYSGTTRTPIIALLFSAPVQLSGQSTGEVMIPLASHFCMTSWLHISPLSIIYSVAHNKCKHSAFCSQFTESHGFAVKHSSNHFQSKTPPKEWW